VKQGGQLASKMRYASGQWDAMLGSGAWLKHARHANVQASKLASGLRRAGVKLLGEPEANSIFAEFPTPVFDALEARG